jgi:hypothetical protein
MKNMPLLCPPSSFGTSNLDGWLFGRAAFGALNKPYLVILIKDAVVPALRHGIYARKRGSQIGPAALGTVFSN